MAATKKNSPRQATEGRGFGWITGRAGITPTKAILSGSAAGIGAGRVGKPKHEVREVRAVKFLANFVLEKPNLLFRHRAAHYPLYNAPFSLSYAQKTWADSLRVIVQPTLGGPGGVGEELNRFSASFGGREIQFDSLHQVIVALSHVNDGKN